MVIIIQKRPSLELAGVRPLLVHVALCEKCGERIGKRFSLLESLRMFRLVTSLSTNWATPDEDQKILLRQNLRCIDCGEDLIEWEKGGEKMNNFFSQLAAIFRKRRKMLVNEHKARKEEAGSMPASGERRVWFDTPDYHRNGGAYQELLTIQGEIYTAFKDHPEFNLTEFMNAADPGTGECDEE